MCITGSLVPFMMQVSVLLPSATAAWPAGRSLQ